MTSSPDDRDQESAGKATADNEEVDAEAAGTIKDGGTNDQNADTDAQINEVPDETAAIALTSGTTQFPAQDSTMFEAGREFGRYRIKRELGRGAMGAVYLARDTQLDREVAVKIPIFATDGGQNEVERFYREARAMATISHPNLCPVYDVGEIDGTHYLTMQFVEGRPLDEYLKRGKSHAPKQVATVMWKLAVALEEAHRAGIVHRDLKPANIMLDQRSEPIIMDFGLARRQKENETTLTQTGQIMGTPSYMSPEQVRGRQDEIGPASDVYALGVICYQLLTGKLPFTGPLGDVLIKIATEEPERPSKLNAKIDRSIEAICLQAMAKSVDDRFGSAADLAKSLRDYLRGKHLPGEGAKPADLIESSDVELSGSDAIAGNEVGRADDSLSDLADGLTSTTDAPVATRTWISPPGPSSQPVPKLQDNRSKQMPKWVWITSGGGVAVLVLAVGIAIKTSGDGDGKGAGGGVALSGEATRDENQAKGNLTNPPNDSTKDQDSAISATATDPPNYGLVFDGKASVEVEGIQYDGRQSFCLEAYIRPTRVDGDHFVMKFCYGIWLLISERDWLGLATQKGNHQVFGAELAKANERVHVALVRDGNELRIYVNGKQGDNNVMPADIIDTRQSNTLLIGRDFEGTIDEVRISSVPRYDQDFAPEKRFEPDEQTVALYHFDEGDGITAKDSSGNKHHGKIQDARWVLAGVSDPPKP